MFGKVTVSFVDYSTVYEVEYGCDFFFGGAHVESLETLIIIWSTTVYYIEALDVISESPTDARKTTYRNSSSILSRSRLNGKTQKLTNNSFESRKFRRIKSDSTLQPTNRPENGLPWDNLSEIFRNDFIFLKAITPMIPDNNVEKETSNIRVSQIEAIFHNNAE
uniref:Uncharacterized protein n=1 Tax=Glossina austeni TaxID=7395 RepID=A0A1A9VGV3_GLOAU